jgi:hypothetical protein
MSSANLLSGIKWHHCLSRKSDMSSEFKHHMFKAKSWHEDALAPQVHSACCMIINRTMLSLAHQGDDALQRQLSTNELSERVKVMPGGTASLPRIPVDHEDDLDLPTLNQRRDYAQFILAQRMDDVATRHRNEIKKLYYPYVENV